MQEIKWSKDGKVCFEPITHTYWNGKTQLQGITSYISSLHSRFDSTAMAVSKSDKPWELLREWKIKGNTSRDLGTSAHTVMENYFLTGKVTALNGGKDNVAIQFINENFETGKLRLIEVESIVYNENLASMRDAIVENSKGEYFIFDWKTNSSISKDNYGKFMFEPYGVLPDASYYHYSLQLRLYQNMSKDYPIKNCFIIHLKDDSYEFIKAENIFIHN